MADTSALRGKGLRKLKVPNLDEYCGSEAHAGDVVRRLKGIPISRPSNKWQHYYLLLHGVLKRDKASGLEPPTYHERWYYADKLRNVYRNHGLAWSNVHRSMPLWHGYGACVVFLLPPEVRDEMEALGSRRVLPTLGYHLRALMDNCLVDLGARKGSCLRLHPVIHTPDEEKIPCHFHVWLMPFWFTSEDVRALRYDRDTALKKHIAWGEESLRKRPGKDGPVTRWIRSRQFTPKHWARLMKALKAGWRDILKEVFAVEWTEKDGPLVRTKSAERRADLYVPEYHSSLARDELDLARIACYKENGPSVRDRVKIAFFPETGKVSAVFKDGEKAEYDALAFLRRYLPASSVTYKKTTGVYHGNACGDNAIMRVFEAVLSERLKQRDSVLYWATLAPADIRKRLKPDDARRLLESAGEALAIMNNIESKWKEKGSPERLSWERHNRFFSHDYRIVLRYLMYLADRAIHAKRKTATEEETPYQLLRRRPLSEIKAAAEADTQFRRSRFHDAKEAEEP